MVEIHSTSTQTREKLQKWGCIQEDNCVFCSSGVEDCHHLFFACGYSSNIWKEVMRRNGIDRAAEEWRNEYVHALTEIKKRGG